MSTLTDEVGAAHREDYWAAVSAADTDAAHAVAARALEAGLGVEDFLEQVVVEAQRRVGERWATNDWSVAQEHAATAVSEAVVRRLADTLHVGPGPLLLVACAEREWHAMPALVLTTVLRARGLDAVHTGASTSRDELVSTILDRGPRAVLLSASLSSSLPRLRRQVEAVRGTGTPVVVGGRAFTDARRWRTLGATAYAESPARALEVLAELPRHVGAAPALHHPGAAEARALQAGADRIVGDVLAALDLGNLALPPDDWRVVLATHTSHVVDSVASALLCDDPTVLSEARAWLRDVVAGRGGDPAAVDRLWDALAHELRDFPVALTMLAG
ncbi:MAG: cobalamin-dependent protein [Nocardioides marinisabuli]|uniref:cobalamin B12-binding domain-containing protein n=1 Tax=Nocardioides marinisabuli TaxID=419476 RepID=UPI00321C1B5C